MPDLQQTSPSLGSTETTHHTLRRVLQTFWVTTSIKGLPRAVKSQSLATSLSWGVASLGCFAMLVYQTTTLLVQYYQFSAKVTWQQFDVAPLYPDVTVCNQKPYDLFAGLNVSYVEYFARLDQLKQQVLARRASDPNVSADYVNSGLWTELHTQRAYVGNNPSFSGEFALSSINSSFVVDCAWFNWDHVNINTVSPSNIPCKDHVLIRWNPGFYYCYTFKAPTSSLLGFTSIFYIDNYPTTVNKPMLLDLSYSITAGIRISVQNPDAYPEIQEGLNFMPGKEVTIKLVQQEIGSLALPYSPKAPCSNQASLDPTDPKSPYKYSSLACQSVCRQQAYINTCGCIAVSESYTDRQLVSVNNSFCCGNLMYDPASGDVLDLLKKLRCRRYATKPKVKCDCRNACKRDKFSWTVSTANWPRVENQPAFYNNYIRPHPEIYGNKFDAYGETIEGKGNQTTLGLLREIAGIGLIGNNFLQLKVLYGDHSVLTSQEVPTVSSDSLFSNLGGILNLWMGVTVLFAAEVIELLVEMVGVYFRGDLGTTPGPPKGRGRASNDGDISVEWKDSLEGVEDIIDGLNDDVGEMKAGGFYSDALY